MYLQAQHFLLAHICPHHAQKDSNSTGLFSQPCLHSFSFCLAHFALLCGLCCGVDLCRRSALFVCTLVFLYRLTGKSNLIWWVLPLEIKTVWPDSLKKSSGKVVSILRVQDKNFLKSIVWSKENRFFFKKYLFHKKPIVRWKAWVSTSIWFWTNPNYISDSITYHWMQQDLLASGVWGQRLKEQHVVPTQRNQAHEKQQWNLASERRQGGRGGRRQEKAAGEGCDGERLNENGRFLTSTAKQWQRGGAAGLRDRDLAEG